MRYSIKHFIHDHASGGILLMLAAALALIAANSPLSGFYQNTLQSSVVIFWVNDGLMAVFFLLVGLEIKREIVKGELATREKALQPVFAAIGGMVVPALIFLGINRGEPDTLAGWAIPCATDIAFALGVLGLLGKGVPTTVKVLLTAVAILDDLGAILIIAFFYSGSLQWDVICVPLTAFIGLVALNKLKETYLVSYLFCGAVLWVGFLKLGIHPTLAGVVTALFIPLQSKKKRFSPAGNLEHFLHPWVAFFVMPVFALCNAGLSFDGLAFVDLTKPLAGGILAGLLLGKPLGIMGGLIIGHVMGLARKPKTAQWKDYAGLAVLCGVGFTMSLFIGDLAFDDPVMTAQVKAGVLSASLLSAVIGYGVSRFTLTRS